MTCVHCRRREGEVTTVLGELCRRCCVLALARFVLKDPVSRNERQQIKPVTKSQL